MPPRSQLSAVLPRRPTRRMEKCTCTLPSASRNVTTRIVLVVYGDGVQEGMLLQPRLEHVSGKIQLVVAHPIVHIRRRIELACDIVEREDLAAVGHGADGPVAVLQLAQDHDAVPHDPADRLYYQTIGSQSSSRRAKLVASAEPLARGADAGPRQIDAVGPGTGKPSWLKCR